METATESEEERHTAASYKSHPERQADFSDRVLECVSNAFHAVGTSPDMEDYIYWRLSLVLNEIVDRPQKFMEALEAIYGEAGALVYEYKLVKEIQREFRLLRAPEKEEPSRTRGPGELLQAALNAAWMAR